MTEPFQARTLKQLSCFNEDEVTAGITSRNDGYSEVPYQSLNMGLHVSDDHELVIKNRKALAVELDIPLEQWVMGEQVHGVNIHLVSKDDLGKGVFNPEDALKGIDGLLTNEKNILLTAFYADCVPLLFFEPESKWAGIAHAGWKGTVHEIARRMIERLDEQGAERSKIKMVIGPCISRTDYEVDDYVVNHIDDKFKDKVTERTEKNKFKLDLKELNKLIAVDAGMLEENIQVSGYCTYNDSELFFSHRRDSGRTGRMLAYIGR
ncbi:peptidoglycan editing factor PgeF [Halobacillus sp. A5]|uniref:peptidoglycan editing factor PgeF n=1 Tax=Halobacillus sp. A5 TaxID=2880263 RepID=UPI0020A657D1|nr:peptidoglycan editing factor PgeF [Halobacillus sp. A5]MCP3026199.1 peptidoglycan editing factor PgeF [Halobacillus sp. A5]